MNLLHQTTFTAEEYLSLPDWKGYELVDGTLVEHQMGAESCYIGGRLHCRLVTFCEDPFKGWIFASDATYQFIASRPNLVRRPDVSLVLQGRFADERVPTGHIRLAPDLVVEVVSPNDLFYEVEEKVTEYRAAGVRLIWVVIPPSRTVLIRRDDGSGTEISATGKLDGEDVLPGFTCPVSELFRHVGPAR